MWNMRERVMSWMTFDRFYFNFNCQDEINQ